MKKEHRAFTVLLQKGKWCVVFMKKRISFFFDTKKEASEYKEYLESR